MNIRVGTILETPDERLGIILYIGLQSSLGIAGNMPRNDKMVVLIFYKHLHVKTLSDVVSAITYGHVKVFLE